MPNDPGPQTDISQLVDGPFIITFTARLPFPAGIPNDLGHSLTCGQFIEAEAVRNFGPGGVSEDTPF